MTIPATEVIFSAAGAGAVNMTVENKLRESISVLDFGAYGDGVIDEREQIQAALDYVHSLGGGRVIMGFGKTYRVDLRTQVEDRGLIIPEGVELDGKGSTIALRCYDGDVYGVRLRTRATIRNCTVAVVESVNPPTQGVLHCPISVGAAYGDGGTAAVPSTFENMRGWGIYDVVVSNVKAQGGCGISIIGHSYDGVIQGVHAPASGVMAGVVNLDWGGVGPLDAADVPASRVVFDNGLGYTTHPHDIAIRNVSCGALAYEVRDGEGVLVYGGHCVRISGCHNITIDGVDAEATGYCGLYITAGDFGYELAPSAVKLSRLRGITVSNATVRDAINGYGFYCDFLADNVQEAVEKSAYVPLLPTESFGGIVFSNCRTAATPSVAFNYGWRLRRGAGFTLNDCGAYNHYNGLRIDDGAADVCVNGGLFDFSRSDNIHVGGGTVPRRVRLNDVTVRRAGSDESGSSLIYLANGEDLHVTGCVLGSDSATLPESARYGVRAGGGVLRLCGHDNNVLALDQTEAELAYAIGAAESYEVLFSWGNNRAAVGIPVFGGVNIITVNTEMAPGGEMIRRCLTYRETLSGDYIPPSGTWTRGTTFRYALPSASGGKQGAICVATGAVGGAGVFATYGSIDPS